VIWARVYVPHAARSERILEVCGTPENVAMAEYVHAFLMSTAERLWKEACALQPGLRRGDKSAFMVGVVGGFSDKLRGARREQQGAGLVWTGDPALASYFQKRHPRMRAAARSRTSRVAAHALGRAEGQKVVLHRPLEGKGAGGRLLPSG